MAMDVTLDIFEGAAIDVGVDEKRFLRPVMVEGIDTAAIGGNKAEAMWVAQEAVKAAAEANPLAGTRADMSMTRIILRATSDSAAKGHAVYERVGLGFGEVSTFVVRDGAFLTNLETNRFPGTHQPIVVTWTDPDNPSIVIEDRVTFRILRPLRAIEIDALRFGRPGQGGQGAVRGVNNAAWPSSYDDASAILPKGFWQITEFQTAEARYAGYYTLHAKALTKIDEDWSETGTLVNRQTGRYVKVLPADVTALMTPAYSYGVTTANGIARVGFYPLLDFPAIMGF